MRLLVQSLIRIFGIFYCVKAIDSSAGSIYSYIIQKSFMSQDVAGQMPNPLAILLPTMFLYLMIAVGLFLAAPVLSRLIVPEDSAKDMKCDSLDLAVITSASLLISAWVFIRIIDYAYPLIERYSGDEVFHISDSDIFYIISNLVILLATFLMIKRMPMILNWLKNKH